MSTCSRGLGTRFEFRLQQHGPRLRAGLRDFHISVRNEPSGRMKLDVLQPGITKQCAQLINSKQVAFMPIVHVPRQISTAENLATLFGADVPTNRTDCLPLLEDTRIIPDCPNLTSESLAKSEWNSLG